MNNNDDPASLAALALSAPDKDRLCLRCGSEMSCHVPELEPTPLCDTCAHAALRVLATETNRLIAEAAHQKQEREASEAEVESLYRLLRSLRDCLNRASEPDANAHGMALRLSALVAEALR